MKRFLFAAAVATAIAACTPAYAVDFAAENNAGGHLVLTDKPCPVDAPEAKDFRAAFTYSAEGDITLGCWVLAGGRVIVAWLDDGSVAEYDPMAFRKVDASTRPSTGKRGERDA